MVPDVKGEKDAAMNNKPKDINEQESRVARTDGLLLSLDSATSSMTASLSRGRELLGQITSTAERNHSIYLVPQIEKLLSEAGFGVEHLSAIACGSGPGSYTGVRIGVTVAKTYAWARQFALIGVSSMETLALGGAARYCGEQTEETTGSLQAVETISLRTEGRRVWFVPVVDARRGQAFTALFESCPAAGYSWHRLHDDGIRLMSSWLDGLAEQAAQAAEKPDLIVVTGETELHVEAIQQLRAQAGCEVVIVPHLMQARHTAELALLRWSAGLMEEIHSFVPNYTQLAEAEVKLLARKP